MVGLSWNIIFQKKSSCSIITSIIESVYGSIVISTFGHILGFFQRINRSFQSVLNKSLLAFCI